MDTPERLPLASVKTECTLFSRDAKNWPTGIAIAYGCVMTQLERMAVKVKNGLRVTRRASASKRAPSLRGGSAASLSELRAAMADALEDILRTERRFPRV